MKSVGSHSHNNGIIKFPKAFAECQSGPQKYQGISGRHL